MIGQQIPCFGMVDAEYLFFLSNQRGPTSGITEPAVLLRRHLRQCIAPDIVEQTRGKYAPAPFVTFRLRHPTRR